MNLGQAVLSHFTCGLDMGTSHPVITHCTLSNDSENFKFLYLMKELWTGQAVFITFDCDM